MMVVSLAFVISHSFSHSQPKGRLLSSPGSASLLPLVYNGAVNSENERAARAARAAARRASMAFEVVRLGQPKPSPYANSSVEERLAAAVRLIDHHQALRGGYSMLPRAEWPGETFIVSWNHG